MIPEALRQVRVAVRRLRLLRRIFRKQLPAELADAIDEGLAELGRALGPARDLDVWLEWLQREDTRRALGRHRLWEPLVEHFRRRRALEQAHVTRALRGAHFAALRLKLARLTRTELPARLQESPGKPGALEKLAVRRWEKFLKRVRKRAKLRHSSSDEKLHELRVTMRRARYVGEFFAEILPKKEMRRARRLRQVEKLLGRVHDIQMALEHHLPSGPTAPRAVKRLLRREQMQLLDQVDALWDKIGL
ncbi:MAG: CHAD domain-containing protein [Verrucomicrobiae bacterium]|nr:CHAD domain-containing protein [Verrucomicrobiae bacterium]